MVVKRFSGSFKTRTDILDNITPNNVVQPNVSVPAGEWKPSNWLPIVWQGEASKDNFVMSSGKVICLTREGRVCLAGFKLLAEQATVPGAGFVAYQQRDVNAGVISLATGQVCTVGTETIEACAQGIVARGLVDEQEALTLSGSGQAVLFAALIAAPGVPIQDDLDDAIAVMMLFFSEPVGVLAYDIYCWAGDAPGELNQANYQKQHLIQFFTDIQMQVPVMADGSDTTSDTLTLAGNLTAFNAAAHGAFPSGDLGNSDLLLVRADLITLTTRYDPLEIGPDVVAIALDTGGVTVAAATDRTPLTSSVAGTTVIVNQKSSVAQVVRAGDWFLDADVGLLFVFDTGGLASPFAAGETVTFTTYEDGTPTAATSSQLVHLDGDPKPGDFVTFDDRANFVPLDTAGHIDMAGNNPGRVIGRVLALIDQPRGLLDRVRTAYAGSSFGADARMPGSATKGFTDLITAEPEAGANRIANRVAIINVKVQ